MVHVLSAFLGVPMSKEAIDPRTSDELREVIRLLNLALEDCYKLLHAAERRELHSADEGATDRSS